MKTSQLKTITIERPIGKKEVIDKFGTPCERIVLILKGLFKSIREEINRLEKTALENQIRKEHEEQSLRKMGSSNIIKLDSLEISFGTNFNANINPSPNPHSNFTSKQKHRSRPKKQETFFDYLYSVFVGDAKPIMIKKTPTHQQLEKRGLTKEASRIQSLLLLSLPVRTGREQEIKIKRLSKEFLDDIIEKDHLFDMLGLVGTKSTLEIQILFLSFLKWTCFLLQDVPFINVEVKEASIKVFNILLWTLESNVPGPGLLEWMKKQRIVYLLSY